MTAEEWVHKINQLARRLDDMTFPYHPTSWNSNPDYARLRAEYLALAKVETAEMQEQQS